MPIGKQGPWRGGEYSHQPGDVLSSGNQRTNQRLKIDDELEDEPPLSHYSHKFSKEWVKRMGCQGKQRQFWGPQAYTYSNGDPLAFGYISVGDDIAVLFKFLWRINSFIKTIISPVMEAKIMTTRQQTSTLYIIIWIWSYQLGENYYALQGFE